jgi:hypothetical protein
MREVVTGPNADADVLSSGCDEESGMAELWMVFDS